MKKYFKTYNMTTVIDVPVEYEYIAFDKDLSVWVYTNRPKKLACGWCNLSVCSRKIDCRPYCDHWTRSLRRLYPVKEG